MPLNVSDSVLQPVQLAHGVVLCAVIDSKLIVGEVAGDSHLLADILDYAGERACVSVLFHTSRKGLLVKALDATNAARLWRAPAIVGYVVEVGLEGA